MRLVFCCDPTAPRAPEPAFEREVAAARELGIPFDLVDHDALVTGRLDRAAPRVEPLPAPEAAVYRGWMLPAARYEGLYRLLGDRGRALVNPPPAYRHCHHLPESYPVIREHTPRTAWLPLRGPLDLDRVMATVAPFGERPLVLKDYVKSEKHAWAEACFIPSAADRAAVERVVRRFLELRGPDLAEGLVFREYVPLEQVGVHPRSGMPLSRELRLLHLDGQPLLSFRYWDEAAYDATLEPPPWLAEVARRVKSRFFTLDLARSQAGEWLVVELGDGQVTGLPEAADPGALFSALRRGLERTAARLS